MPLQLLDDQPELADLAVTALFVGDEIAQQPLQQLRIGRQIVKVDAHASTLRCGADSINPDAVYRGLRPAVAEQTLHPARCGFQRRSGIRQFTPSSSMPSCVRLN